MPDSNSFAHFCRNVKADEYIIPPRDSSSRKNGSRDARYLSKVWRRPGTGNRPRAFGRLVEGALECEWVRTAPVLSIAGGAQEAPLKESSWSYASFCSLDGKKKGQVTIEPKSNCVSGSVLQL
jgi:hypothetical protein